MTTANAAQTLAESIEATNPSAIGVQAVVESVAANPTLGAYAAQVFIEALSPNVSPYLSFTSLIVQTLPEPNADRDLTLRYSDDGGASWSDTITQTIGAIGQYETSIQFRRMGLARNRVVELSWSGSFETALTGAFISYQISQT